MRELPGLRHPAPAARGRHPILAFSIGDPASELIRAAAERRAACPTAVVP
jgi:hypothetical protein